MLYEVITVMLALALAFGLGGRGMVERLLNRESEKREHDDDHQEPSPL